MKRLFRKIFMLLFVTRGNGDERLYSPQTLQDTSVIRKWDKFTTLFFYISNDAVRTCAACCSAQKHDRDVSNFFVNILYYILRF